MERCIELNMGMQEFFAECLEELGNYEDCV